MRTILVGFALALAAAVAAAPAAHALSISADVPLAYTFDEGDIDDGTVSGFRVGVGFGLLGVGYNSYEATGDLGLEDDIVVKYQMLDVFFELPIPIVNIVVGAGAGTAEADDLTNVTIEGANTNVTFDSATATMVFASVGFPILPLFDIHLGYHVIRAETDLEGKSGGVVTFKDSIDLGGSLISVGARLGF